MRTEQAIEEFIDSRIANSLSPLTIEWYAGRLKPFARLYPELPQEPRSIESFLAGVAGCPETRRAYFIALRTFFRFISERYETPNPVVKVSPPRCAKKMMATLEPGDMMRLLHSAPCLRDRALLTLFLDTGMRTSEAAGLRKRDIKTDTVRVQGKTGEREIPISDETRRLLMCVIASDGNGEHVFHGQKGPLTRKGIYRIVRICMRKAGIVGTKLGGHRLRHSFGKGYVVNGGDLRSLQQIMGHASIATTQKYVSLNLSDIIEKHHKFTPLHAVQAAAQESFFNAGLAVKPAEAVLHSKN